MLLRTYRVGLKGGCIIRLYHEDRILVQVYRWELCAATVMQVVAGVRTAMSDSELAPLSYLLTVTGRDGSRDRRTTANGVRCVAKPKKSTLCVQQVYKLSS